MVEPAVFFYGLKFRIFESEFLNPIEPEVRFRHFAHTMVSTLINKVKKDQVQRVGSPADNVDSLE